MLCPERETAIIVADNVEPLRYRELEGIGMERERWGGRASSVHVGVLFRVLVL